jgi:uncharacterized protein YndB with AHSA1/START domain
MLEIVIGITLVLVLAVLALFGYAATKPGTFSVSRSQKIAAPAERIFPLIANLRQMNTWNPFLRPDPGIELEYLGPESGPGAKSTWRGNRNVGEGQIAIVDAAPPKRIAMKLDMMKPMTAHNDVMFTQEEGPDGTNVTWSMSGAQPLLAKVISTFVDCDRMVGGVFQQGLRDLKAKAEA